MLTAYHT